MLGMNYQDIFLLNFLRQFEKISGRKRIQKLVYLINKKYHHSIPFNFRNYYYGPYSSELYHSLTRLEAFGLIDEEMVEINVENKIGYMYMYALSDRGRIVANMTRSKLPNNLLRIFDKVYIKYKYTPTETIMKEVYKIAKI